jgi:hypothetical protein
MKSIDMYQDLFVERKAVRRFFGVWRGARKEDPKKLPTKRECI